MTAHKIVVRRRWGARGGWKLVIDGVEDKNHYDLWVQAVESAVNRLQTWAMTAAFNKIKADPLQAAVLPIAHVRGSDLKAKRGNLAQRAYEHRVHVRVKVDGDNFVLSSGLTEQAEKRFRTKAVQSLYDEVRSVPRGEYVGIPAHRICGDTIHQKREILTKAARRRGLKVDIVREDDGEENYDFYVALVGRKA